MLLWFCDEDVVHRVAEGGQLAEDDEIEVQPDCITDEVIDCDISSLKCYFTVDGWILAQQTGKRW